MRIESVEKYSFLKVISLIITLTAALTISPQIHAGSIEAAQWIPWSFLTKELSNLSLNYELHHQNASLSFGEFRPTSSQYDLKLESAKSAIITVDQNGIELGAEHLNAVIRFKDLNIDQVLTRQVGGHNFQIRIQAQCQGFELAIKDFALLARSHFEIKQFGEKTAPLLRLGLNQLQILLKPNSWDLSTIRCQGPQGFDQMLSEQISGSLSNISVVQDFLKPWLSQQIESKFDFIWKNLTEKSFQSFQIKGVSETMNSGIYLLGDIQTDGKDVIRFKERLLEPADLFSGKASNDKPKLILSIEGFVGLVSENLKSFGRQSLNLQNISSFNRLMHSRFLQFFIWPDLMNIAKSSPVLLKVDEQRARMDLVPTSSGAWNFSLQTQGVVTVERQKQAWNYLNFGLGLGSKIQIQVKDSVLSVNSTNSQTSFSWGFDRTYIDKFHPSQRVPSSMLKDSVQSFFDKRSFTQVLPVLDWKGRQMKLNSFVEQNSLIYMEWKE